MDRTERKKLKLKKLKEKEKQKKLSQTVSRDGDVAKGWLPNYYKAIMALFVTQIVLWAVTAPICITGGLVANDAQWVYAVKIAVPAILSFLCLIFNILAFVVVAKFKYFAQPFKSQIIAFSVISLLIMGGYIGVTYWYVILKVRKIISVILYYGLPLLMVLLTIPTLDMVYKMNCAVTGEKEKYWGDRNKN